MTSSPHRGGGHFSFAAWSSDSPVTVPLIGAPPLQIRQPLVHPPATRQLARALYCRCPRSPDTLGPMNLKIGGSTRAPWMTVRSDGNEIWGPLRAPAALMAALGGIVACFVMVSIGAAVTVAAPAIACTRMSVRFQGREVPTLPGRIAASYLVGIGTLVSGILGAAALAVAIPVAPVVAALQATVRGGARIGAKLTGKNAHPSIAPHRSGPEGSIEETFELSGSPWDWSPSTPPPPATPPSRRAPTPDRTLPPPKKQEGPGRTL